MSQSQRPCANATGCPVPTPPTRRPGPNNRSVTWRCHTGFPHLSCRPPVPLGRAAGARSAVRAGPPRALGGAAAGLADERGVTLVFGRIVLGLTLWSLVRLVRIRAGVRRLRLITLRGVGAMHDHSEMLEPLLELDPSMRLLLRLVGGGGGPLGGGGAGGRGPPRFFRLLAPGGGTLKSDGAHWNGRRWRSPAFRLPRGPRRASSTVSIAPPTPHQRHPPVPPSFRRGPMELAAARLCSVRPAFRLGTARCRRRWALAHRPHPVTTATCSTPPTPAASATSLAPIRWPLPAP